MHYISARYMCHCTWAGGRQQWVCMFFLPFLSFVVLVRVIKDSRPRMFQAQFYMTGHSTLPLDAKSPVQRKSERAACPFFSRSPPSPSACEIPAACWATYIATAWDQTLKTCPLRRFGIERAVDGIFFGNAGPSLFLTFTLKLTI